MKPLDLVEVLQERPAEFAFFATYEFDPGFFERRLLSTKALAGALRIVLFMDAGRYQELLANDLPVRKLNRRYLVLPTRPMRPGGVFHPKLVLLVGEQRTTLIVGSSNCTRPGFGHNLELGSVVRLDDESSADNKSSSPQGERAVRSSFALLQRFAEGVSPSVPVQQEFFERAADKYPWLASAFRPPDEAGPELLHTLDGGLWEQVVQRLQGKTVSRVCVLSPFYDAGTSLFGRVLHQWPGCTLEVTAQQGHGNLPARELSAWAVGAEDRFSLWGLTGAAWRRLHAKAMAFQTSEFTYWLTGSANFTTAALDGKNVETALWFSTRANFHASLFGSGLSRVLARPDAFQAGMDLPPEEHPPQATPPLRLDSAILGIDGELLLNYRVDRELEPESLRVLIRNAGESDPCLSFDLPTKGRTESRVAVSEAQLFHAAALAELVARRQGIEVRSRPVWIVQVGRLTPDPHDGRSAASAGIVSTGKEFQARMEELDRNGQPDDLIAYLDHCNIPFEDGAGNWYHRAARWGKPRNPFRGDESDSTFGSMPADRLERLKQAIKDFVKRHQEYKLRKHVRNGNLNGLHNFVDIVRAIIHLLAYWHGRKVAVGAIGPKGQAVVLSATVIGVVDNTISLFAAFLDAVRANHRGGDALIRTRLEEEKVSALLGAALRWAQELRATLGAADSERPERLLPSMKDRLLSCLAQLRLPASDARGLEWARQEYGLLAPAAGRPG